MITRGDNHNCPCPHCGKTNHSVVRGVAVPFRRFVWFSRPCFHCKRPVYYEASWELAVTAETNPHPGFRPPPESLPPS